MIGKLSIIIAVVALPVLMMIGATSVDREKMFVEQWKKVIQLQSDYDRIDRDKYNAEMIKLINMPTDPRFDHIKLFMLRVVFANDLAAELQDESPLTSITIRKHLLRQISLVAAYLKGLQDAK